MSLYTRLTTPGRLLGEFRGILAEPDPEGAGEPPGGSTLGYLGAVAGFIARRVQRGEFKYGRLKGWAIRDKWEPGVPFRIPAWGPRGYPDLDEEQKSRYRQIFGLSLPDLLLHTLVARELSQAVDGRLSDSCYSYRRGRGRPQVIRRVHSLIVKRKYRWAVRYDVRHFNETVDYGRLKEELLKMVPDTWPQEDVRVLLGCLDALFEFGRRAGYGEGKGLLLGSPLTGVLSNVYLTAVDQATADEGVDFARYGDDVVAFADSEEQADRVLESIDSVVRRDLGQERNADKSGIFEIEKCMFSPSRGVAQVEREYESRDRCRAGRAPNCGLPLTGGFDFLGFHFDRESYRIREQTMVKIASKIRMVTQRGKARWRAVGLDLPGDEDCVIFMEVMTAIAGVNRRLGYKPDVVQRTGWRFAGKGWVDSHAACGVTADMVEQFRALGRFIRKRVLHLSNRCLNAAGLLLPAGPPNLWLMGLRSPLDALGDSKRLRRLVQAGTSQRTDVNEAPLPRLLDQHQQEPMAAAMEAT